MEIFTPEFREELFDSLETISIGLKKDLPPQKVNELTDKINSALENEMKYLKPKKKKKNQFEEGDVVYWGELQGVVVHKENSNLDTALGIDFINNSDMTLFFTEDGRYFAGTPRVLSHFPYKLKMKKI